MISRHVGIISLFAMIAACGSMAACSGGHDGSDAGDAGAPDVTRPPDGTPLPDSSLPDSSGGDFDVRVDREAGGDWQDVVLPDVPKPDGLQPDTRIDGDGAVCTIEPVWTASANGFVYSERGGLPPPIPPDAECRGYDYKIAYDAKAKTLSQVGCVDSHTVTRTVELTDEENARILATIGNLHTTCTKACGADAPEMTVVVQSPNAPGRSFQSNFYAGCQGQTVPPPYIAFNDLFQLHSVVGGIISAACEGPEGGTPEAGTCRTPPVDAGTDVQNDGDAATCQPAVVGQPFSPTFRMTRSGGLLPPTVPDAACQGTDVVIEFSTQKWTLTQSGCVNGESVARLINLSQMEISEINSKLGALSTTCQKGCGADAPDMALAVGNCNTPPTTTTYSSNFYAGCPGNAVAPPYIAFDDLRGFYDFISGVINDTCGAPGGVAEAGQCLGLPDGGITGGCL